MEKILTKHFFRFSSCCQTNLTLNRILQWLVEVNASHWWRWIGGWHAMLRREGRRRFAWTWNLFQLFSFENKPQAASAACKRPQMCKVGLEQGKYEDSDDNGGSDDDDIHIFILSPSCCPIFWYLFPRSHVVALQCSGRYIGLIHSHILLITLTSHRKSYKIPVTKSIYKDNF